MRIQACLLSLLVPVAAVNTRATDAQWVHFNTNHFLVYSNDDLGNHISDFSYAGFQGGGVALPTNAVVKTNLSAVVGDNTSRIQGAINSVSSMSPDATGFRGVVLLNPGIYEVDGTLTIGQSGVVLRGSGNSPTGTELHFLGSSRQTISVAGTGSVSQKGSSINITNVYLPLGATNFIVTDPSSFAVGNLVVVHRPVTQAWIDAIGENVTNVNWQPSSGLAFERTITAVNGNQLSIDIPLFNPIEQQWVTGYVYTATESSGRITNTAIENLRLRSDFADASTNWGSSRALNFDNMKNCWFRDIVVDNFYNGINSGGGAKWCTVQDCSFVSNTVPTTSAGAAAFGGSGQMLLWQRCGSSNSTTYHVFVTQAAVPGPYVFLNFNSIGSGYDCGPHQRWAAGILIDHCTAASSSGGNIGIKLENRGTAGSGQGYGAGYSIIYNGNSVGIINEIPQVNHHYNWAIGRGTSAATFIHRSDDGIFDTTNAMVNPTSLYLEQLKERLGGRAVENIGYQLFSISGTPATQSITAGTNTIFTVNVGDPTLMSNVVALSVSGVPVGASVSLNTNSVTGAGSAMLTVTTSNSLPPGSYTLSLIGASAGLSHTSLVTLIVGSFVLSATPPSQTILPGNNTSYTVSVSTNGNFSGAVDLGFSGLPANATASFTPASLGGSGSATLNVITASNTPAGNFTLTILGTNMSGVASTSAALNILTTSANPGLLVWTNGSGADTNWSTIFNWTNVTAGGYGPPDANNSVLFTNFGAVVASALTSPGSGVVVPAAINSFANTSFSISALTNFANAPNTSPIYQNIGIATGATLAINNLQVGGFTGLDFGANNVTTLTISGSGASVQQGGGVTVSQDSASTGPHDAMLDMSGLDSFTMDGQQIRVGVEGGGSAKRASGILYLAKTNSLMLLSAGYSDSTGSGSPASGNPALYFGHNTSVFGSGSQIYLGITNAIFADYATIGRGDTNALFAFNPAFVGFTPTVYIRGTNGDPARVGIYVVGDGSSGAVANNAPSTNDFSGGLVDAMINYLCVGRGRNTSSLVGGSGVLTFDGGIINASELIAGFIYPVGSNSPASGAVNVNGTATLLVQSNIVLAQNANVPGQTAVSQGTLNINGGIVEAENVVGGGGVSTVALNSGVLSFQGGAVANISAINIGVTGGTVPAVLSGASSVSVSNALTIATNGVVMGNTAITSPGLTVSGTISPGLNDAGWLTNNGPATFAGGGHFSVAVEDASGSPVEGWDFLGVNGALNVQATSTNPFTIDLLSLGGDGSDVVTNFSFNTNYDWVITTAGGISNFDPNAFTIDSSQFQNDLAGGYFYLHTNANSLILSFSNNLPPMAGTAEFYRGGNVTLIPLASLATHWSDPDGDPVVFTGVSGSTNGAAVGADNNFIYYTNFNNVVDDITYTVSDVRINPPAVYQLNDTVLTAVGNIVLLPPASISTINLAGTNVILGSSNGIAGNGYSVLVTTNLTLPLNNWSAIQSGSFDTNGNLRVTNGMNPSVLQEFYRLQLQ
jgi:hypothetical protein